MTFDDLAAMRARRQWRRLAELGYCSGLDVEEIAVIAGAGSVSSADDDFGGFDLEALDGGDAEGT